MPLNVFISSEINVPNIHVVVVVEQVSHRANLASPSQHVKWYPASLHMWRAEWVGGWRFAVIIGNYFWISTRLGMIAENRRILQTSVSIVHDEF